jgi:hypothetical protein
MSLLVIQGLKSIARRSISYRCVSVLYFFKILYLFSKQVFKIFSAIVCSTGDSGSGAGKVCVFYRLEILIV